MFFHFISFFFCQNPDLKIILAIGGWAFGAAPFKELTSNVFRMNQFVYDSTEFLRNNNFDGLDIDWEYPRSDSFGAQCSLGFFGPLHVVDAVVCLVFRAD